MLRRIIVICFSILFSTHSLSDDGEPEPGRHLVEVGYTSIDGFDSDIRGLALGYTYSYSRNLRLTAQTIMIDLDFSAASDSEQKDSAARGQGDSIIAIQYDPGANLTASPWVPNSLGIFGALLLPTGNVKEGLSNDSWGATVGAGWPIFFGSNRVIIPSVAYSRSYSHSSLSTSFEEFGFSASFLWLAPQKFWVGIEPTILWDFQSNETIYQYTAVMGKSFANGIGIDLRFGNKKRFERYADRDDRVLFLNLSWQFGQATRD